MRSDLEQIAQIDQYLSGKMSPDQMTAFEAQINADPALKSLVQDQQLLIQTIGRKAMMAEINTVAGLAVGAAAGSGATAAGWGLTQWILAGLVAVGATVGGVAIYNATSSEQTESVQETKQHSEENNLLTDNTFDTSEYFAYVPAVDNEGMEDESDDAAYEENERTVYDPAEDRSLFDMRDPLNEFGNVHHVNTVLDQEENTEVAETDHSSGIVRNRKASYPGGHLALQKWFEKNLMYPGTAKEDQVQGTIRVRFHVKETGEIEIVDSECIQLLDESDKLIDGWRRVKYRKAIKYFRRNAERAFRICPEWIPATNTNGTSVLSEQVWYVKYNLNDKTEVYSFGEDTGYRSTDLEEDEFRTHSNDAIFFEVQTAEDKVTEPTSK